MNWSKSVISNVLNDDQATLIYLLEASKEVLYVYFSTEVSR